MESSPKRFAHWIQRNFDLANVLTGQDSKKIEWNKIKLPRPRVRVNFFALHAVNTASCCFLVLGLGWPSLFWWCFVLSTKQTSFCSFGEIFESWKVIFIGLAVGANIGVSIYVIITRSSNPAYVGLGCAILLLQIINLLSHLIKC